MQRFSRLHNSIQRSRRSVVSGLLALSLLAGTGFVPSLKFSLGSLTAPSTDVRPFPCQHHACGCKDAASCGTRCCCFTPAQVRDWERRHASEIAAYERRHAPQINSSANVTAAKSTKPCCSHCQAVKPPAAAAKPTSSAQEPTPAPASDADSASGSDTSLAVTWISLDAQRRCRGVAPFWVVMAQALPADLLPPWRPTHELLARLPLVGQRPLWRAFPPATPPPR